MSCAITTKVGVEHLVEFTTRKRKRLKRGTGEQNMPTDDYIKRSDALMAIQECFDKELEFSYDNAQSCMNRINTIPAADVEPKRSIGWWIPGDYVAVEHGECVTYPGEGITCSCCHYGFKGRFLWSREYCPHCGSRMLPETPKETDGDEQTSEDI